MTPPEFTPSSTRPFEEPALPGEPRLDGLARLLAVVDRLRAPEGGCPWDLEQTAESLTGSLVEEAFEAVEAIEVRAESEGVETTGVVGELGDVLMNLVLIARIEEQAGRAHLGEVASAVADKLVRRHPHVFGEVVVEETGEVLRNWEAIKRAERAAAAEDTSALAGLPRGLPALQRAARACGKAASAGFRWRDARGALAKLREELEELEEAFAQQDGPARQAALEAELGDVLLAAACFGRYAGVEPEGALRSSLRRFEARFRRMEAALGGALAGADLPALLAAWEVAKGQGARGADSPGGSA